jgi:hypothetical protein
MGIFVLVFVNDLHLAAGGQNRWLTIWRFLVALEMVGVPFSYLEFRGGFQMDYVGYWMDYSVLSWGFQRREPIGLSNLWKTCSLMAG